MGCCYSILEAVGLKSSTDFQSLSTIDEDGLPLNLRKPSPANTNEGVDATQATAKEEKIELVLRSKRTNVFSTGFDISADFEAKIVPKTKRQTHLLKKAIAANFLFQTLSEEEQNSVVDAMEPYSAVTDQIIINQGDEGDFFYIIESGLCTVLVNNKAVGKLGDGKSFGDIALFNNAPRAATIRADMDSSLWCLDRVTFRHTLAKSSAAKHKNSYEALSKVPLLKNLFDHQISKIADAVLVVPYNKGDYIIRRTTEGNVMYIIKEGRVKIKDIMIKNDGDKSQFADHILQEGDYFGERALLTNEPRAANVVAETDCVLMALDREAFDSLLGPLKDVIEENSNLNIIKTIKLFNELTEDDRTKIVRSYTKRSYLPGQTIINEGDHGHEFFIVKSGEAKVLILGKQVGVLSAGQYFGEMALLDDEVRKATVIASGTPDGGDQSENTYTAGSGGSGHNPAAVVGSPSSVGGTATTDRGSPGGITPSVECLVLDRATFNRITHGSLKDSLAKNATERKKHMARVVDGVSSPSTVNNKNSGIKFTDLLNVGLLGTGKFARVTLAQHRRMKSQVYALKTLSKVEIVRQKQEANVLNERLILADCNFPFIITLENTYQDSMKLYMLLEFVQGGELFSVIHTQDSDGIPDSHAKFYSMVLLLTLRYLHSKDIVYRDLKPENILIDKEGYPKLVDFGFAKVIKGGSKSYTLCGTPEYLAPEIIVGRGYTKSVDYWAFGILVYEMIVGETPFADIEGQDQALVCQNILDGRYTFPTDFNAHCKDMVKKLLDKEAKSRLGTLRNGCADVLQHTWYKDFYTGENKELTGFMNKTVTAPWIPKIKNNLDLSNFDPYEDGTNVSEVGLGDNDDTKNPMQDNYDHGEWEKQIPSDVWSMSPKL